MQNSLSDNDRNADFSTSGSRAARIALAIVSALILYGSLFPFAFRPPADLTVALHALAKNWNPLVSFSDAAGNVLLFMPFGLAAGWLAAAHPSSAKRLVAATFYFFIGISLATGVQVAQIWFPDRTAAIGDVVANLFGLSAGLLAGFAWCRTAGRTAHAYAYFMPACFAAAWLAVELMPLVPTLSFSTVRENLAPLLSRRFGLGEAALSAAGLILVAHFVESSPLARWARWLIPGLAAMIGGGKIIVIGGGLGVGDCAGLLAGMWLWLFVRHSRPAEAGTVAFAALFAAITLRALLPFEFRDSPGDWHWMPFAAWLQGSLLSNVKSLAANAFLYAGLLGLAATGSRPRLGPTFALALWVGLLEVAQVWIEGRSGDMSEPLLVLAAGFLIRLLPRSRSRPRARDLAPSPRPGGRPGRWWPLLGMVATCSAIAIVLGALLRLPNLPYNVAELFLLDGVFVVRALFGVALLWIGIGPVLAAPRLTTGKAPLLTWGGIVLGTGIASLILLSACVTEESIGDIAGAENLHWFVTNRDIWGSAWREIFLALGAPLIGALEHIVRYVALYGPLPVFLTLLWLGATEMPEGRLSWQRYALLGISALPWLWLCKAIAFDWSSTDNLNELIAPDGEWGWGGGGYLYALLGVICASAVLTARAVAAPAARPAAALTLGLAIPLGWWLLQSGLNPAVEKYDSVFSGTQFLLGPDRTRLLRPAHLYVRWSMVQLGCTLAIALGLAHGAVLWRSLARTPPPRPI